jgi:SAM-dependent methyltransferase
MKYSDSDKKINANLYQKFLEMEIDDGWTSSDKLENFELFLTICTLTKLPIEKASVLDVGCGTGDFAYFIGQKKVRQYIGIDIFEEAIKKASHKYPDFDFLVGDFLTLDLPQFDFVYSSGALTTNLHSDNYEMLTIWLKKMWQTAKKGIVFNCLLERFPGDRSDEGLFLYERQKVLEIASGVSNKSKMRAITTDAGCGDGTEELHIYLYK